MTGFLRALTVAVAGLGSLAAEARSQGAIPVDDGPGAAAPADDPGAAFDSRVFLRYGGEAGARARIEAMLASRLAEIDRACRPIEDQRGKLATAGRGDVARFFEQVDESRRAFVARYESASESPSIQRNILANVGSAIVTIRSPFGEGSLLMKTARTTLDESQRARLDEVGRSRLESRHRADVDLVVGTIDRELLLTADQRRRFSALLLAETRPLRQSSSRNYHGMIYQASLIPEARLRPIFDEARWPVVAGELAKARRLGPTLRRIGALPDPEPRRGGSER